MIRIDGEQLSGNFGAQITMGIEASCAFVTYITPTFEDKARAVSQDAADNDWCAKQFSYAHNFLKATHRIFVATSA